MNAPVARNMSSGERTLATNKPSLGTGISGQTKKADLLSKRNGTVVARTLACVASLWGAFGAAPVYASDSMAASSVVKAGIGTLPLLAAMGIGILVSVIAVIAFLQMTAKSKGSLEGLEELEPEEYEEDGTDREETLASGWPKGGRYPSGDESEGPRST